MGVEITGPTSLENTLKGSKDYPSFKNEVKTVDSMVVNILNRRYFYPSKVSRPPPGNKKLSNRSSRTGFRKGLMSQYHGDLSAEVRHQHGGPTPPRAQRAQGGRHREERGLEPGAGRSWSRSSDEFQIYNQIRNVNSFWE